MANKNPTMTETLQALALCAAADWQPLSASEAFEEHGLTYELIGRPLEVANLRFDCDGTLEKLGVRWTDADGLQTIDIVSTLPSADGDDLEPVSVLRLTIYAEQH